MKRLINNPVRAFFLSIVMSIGFVRLWLLIFLKLWYTDIEKVAIPISIIWSSILFSSNRLIKIQEQSRLTESNVTDNNIKLLVTFSNILEIINIWKYKSQQIALIFWLAELAKNHELLKEPTKESLEDIILWSEKFESKEIFNAAKKARESII